MRLSNLVARSLIRAALGFAALGAPAAAWQSIPFDTNTASVMPVSTVISGGIAMPGFTNVWNVPRHSPPRTFTAPISVIRPSVGLPPVVSRSTTQKVVSARAAPSKSRLSWAECGTGTADTCSTL